MVGSLTFGQKKNPQGSWLYNFMSALPMRRLKDLSAITRIFSMIGGKIFAHNRLLKLFPASVR